MKKSCSTCLHSYMGCSGTELCSDWKDCLCPAARKHGDDYCVQCKENADISSGGAVSCLYAESGGLW
jgi:hypothetical protein